MMQRSEGEMRELERVCALRTVEKADREVGSDYTTTNSSCDVLCFVSGSQ